MNMSVDINKVEQFVKDDKFSEFLLKNSTDLAVPAFILQTLLNKIDEVKSMD